MQTDGQHNQITSGFRKIINKKGEFYKLMEKSEQYGITRIEISLENEILEDKSYLPQEFSNNIANSILTKLLKIGCIKAIPIA